MLERYLVLGLALLVTSAAWRGPALAEDALTTLFGILMILLPLAGLLALIWLIGAYSIFFGALLLAVALRLRARWRAQAAAAGPA